MQMNLRLGDDYIKIFQEVVPICDDYGTTTQKLYILNLAYASLPGEMITKIIG